MHFQHVTAVLLLLLVNAHGQATGPDSRGKEFFLSFIENPPFQNENATDMELFIVTASNVPVPVTVTMPLYDPTFSKSLTAVRGIARKVIIPHGARGIGTELTGKSVWVQSTEEISVFAVNKESKSTDAYIALPSDVLGTEYYAMTYIKQAGLAITATQDNTQVNITWPAGTQGVTYGGTTYGAGDTLTLTLDKFQVFHALDSAGTSDFTGAHIVSDKPISVVSGNKKVKVPTYTTKSTSDHLTEMMLPVSTWGKEFITSSTPDRSTGDIFRIMAAEDGTTVILSGGTVLNLDAGDFQDLDVATGSYQTITGTKPIAVAMFSKTVDGDGPTGGDPAMTLIPPVLQYAADNTWSTIQTPDGSDFDNKIAVVIKTSEVDGLRLDGNNITWDSQTVVPASDKTHLWLRVTPGSHNIYHVDPTVTFMAIATGTHDANSYAYLAGLRAARINEPCQYTSNTTMVAGDIVNNDCDDKIDEETLNGIDDDGDQLVDEDLAVPPRIDGQWGAWSTPSPCSVECGHGYMTRTRVCDSPPPANNGMLCQGDAVDYVPCTGNNCAPGPVCLEDTQRCLSGLTCTSGKECPCPSGEHGNGYFECADTGEKTCYAEGDPHIHTWEGSLAAINLPCWFRMSHLATRLPNPEYLEYDYCSLDVQALNELTADGLYYVRTVKVIIRFARYDELGNIEYMDPAENFNIIQEDIRNLVNTTNPWSRSATIINSAPIIPYFDANDQFAILEACGFTVKFRVFAPEEGILKTFKPGVSITSPVGALQLSAAEQTTCRWMTEGHNAYQKRKKTLKLKNNNQVLTHDILNTVDLTHTDSNPDYGTQCQEASDELMACDVSKRPLALHLCSIILNSEYNFLPCLLESAINPLSVFNKCMDWVCDTNTVSCNSYRTDLNGCTRTSLMNQIACVPTTLLTKIAEFNQ